MIEKVKDKLEAAAENLGRHLDLELRDRQRTIDELALASISMRRGGEQWSREGEKTRLNPNLRFRTPYEGMSRSHMITEIQKEIAKGRNRLPIETAELIMLVGISAGLVDINIGITFERLRQSLPQSRQVFVVAGR